MRARPEDPKATRNGVPDDRVLWNGLDLTHFVEELFPFAKRIVPRSESVRCVVHHAVLELMKAIRRGEHVEYPRAYARQAVVSYCSKCRHGSEVRKKFIGNMDCFQAPNGTSDEESRSSKLLDELISRAAGQLPPGQREILELVRDGVVTIDDLAQKVGCSSEAVRARVNRLQISLQPVMDSLPERVRANP